MGLGKQNRLARIFSRETGRLFGVAVDHFVGYDVLHSELRDLPSVLRTLLAAGPDSVTMQPGGALNCWGPHAGEAALMIQAGCFTPDDRISELVATPEDAVRLGADALAVAIVVRGATEGRYLRWLTDTVRDAARLDVPVFAHIYPRVFDEDGPRIVTDAENIAWATRCGVETGVDVIKVAYPGDPEAFRQIVDATPVPVVAAGGVKAESLEAALTNTVGAMAAGARGAIVGRNVWGQDDPLAAARAFRAVIHDGLSPAEAIASTGAAAAAA